MTSPCCPTMDDLDFEEGDSPQYEAPGGRGSDSTGAGWQVAAPHARSSLLHGPFLGKVAAEVMARLPARDAPPQSSHRGRLAKFWYGPHSSIHYEIWLHDRTLQIELGLHCESAPDYNLALYNAFDHCLLEIQAALGTSMWLEEWDHGWTRLYETVPFFPLDADRVDEVTPPIGEIIGTLQPILEEIMSRLLDPPQVASDRRRDRYSPRR